jgi:preprotein translocase subunit Sec61beta
MVRANLGGLGQIAMPAGSGGLMRYNEEYRSSFRLKPSHVIILIVAIIAFVAALKIFWPLPG